MNKASKATRPALQIARPSSGVQRSAAAVEIEDDARIVINVTKRLHVAVKMRATENGKTIRDYMLDLLSKDGIE
jgi:hypothetical protein